MNRPTTGARLASLVLGVTLVAIARPTLAQQEPGRDVMIPHAQDRPPNPAYSPAEAIKAMKLPEGFTAEVVAAEPDIVNPVAMTFDEKGRVWITESLEYPRRSPGPGRDRVKILEDTDGDGKADKFTVFAEGLNIPSGIAVGGGGVWVANAPDILFLQDTDGDGKADKSEVVVTGFGRDDTHELPNSLTWGPDGWLYGWNGVFNQTHVVHRGKTYDFTCAIFRIHPKTREFEVWSEGTSNPWGIAFDREGSAFASACVIDHLWHLLETGYYHRQGGPYPPYTWKMGSIVDHFHQKAAYCGIHFYDSDAYPEAYRGKLYMGNIHGNAINFDRLERNGATYEGIHGPDFLQANDAWFMPVVQKTGPDGCLYILDWYDRYHCYQDANRDPNGIDRLKGRLYRIRYNNTPRAPRRDLATASDDELIGLLDGGNGYARDIAQRLLRERGTEASRSKLQAIVLDPDANRRTRLVALWSLLGFQPLDASFHVKLMAEKDDSLRAWGVRAAGNQKVVADEVRDAVLGLTEDESPDVLVQVAIAAGKLQGVDALRVLLDVATACGEDEVIPHIVWQNSKDRLAAHPGDFASMVSEPARSKAPGIAPLLPRAIERLLGTAEPDGIRIAKLLTHTLELNQHDLNRYAIDALTIRLRDASPDDPRFHRLRSSVAEVLRKELEPGAKARLDRQEVTLLLAYCGDAKGREAALGLVKNARAPTELRLRALDVILYSGDLEPIRDLARTTLVERTSKPSPDFEARFLAALGRVDDESLGQTVLDAYGKLAPENRPRALELLTQRIPWSNALLGAVEAKRVASDALNLNQIRKLNASRDPEIRKRAVAIWGTVRQGRNPQRDLTIDQARRFLVEAKGDAVAGSKVFQKVCAQCHKIFGEGQEVGPEITANGRASYEQLLSNVFDPSLVIGAAYQATTVATTEGRVLVGLLAEDTPQRVVLKLQGGKLETIPRQEVEVKKVAELSLMPEGLENQLTPREMADLFAYITLDRPPTDPAARPIPGTPAGLRK